MRKPLIDEHGEVPELDDAFFKNAKRGRPTLEEDMRKRSVSMRLDPEVVKYFKSTGKGWQTRINEVLKSYVSTH